MTAKAKFTRPVANENSRLSAVVNAIAKEGCLDLPEPYRAAMIRAGMKLYKKAFRLGYRAADNGIPLGETE